jgi:hypothetical protein
MVETIAEPSQQTAATAALAAALRDICGPADVIGMADAVPGLALMRSVKDRFDPGHRMAPDRFPETV